MNERTIFEEALQRATPEARATFLDEACGGDTALRRRVDSLLQSHEQAGSFLGMSVPERLAEQLAVGPKSAPGASAGVTMDQPASEHLGTVIGPYKLLQQIGEGGMGTVFMAEQTQPVQRKVALKILKPGMDSQQVLGRFEAERQALALMDHPNIAKVIEAGTATGEHGCIRAGRPYFVMELVKGVPITKYCDDQHLTPKQRLELFVPVCQAVQHAHQKGIIHRDLKPSNVLVAEYDDRPVAKIIDFGVAKAAGPKLTERTLFTEFGQIVGTLEYMSPEQAKLNALDIDTRSDIYALGVLLYELLTGTTPFEKKRLHSAALDEVLRIIREEEPPKPSTRLSTTEELPSIAANRGLEPKKLSGLVRGELDWIVMKCLEKDRNRRYETANGLAMDVQHYLADEPVQACPPSASYRLRKFVRRNRHAVLAASLVSAALLIGTAVSTWQWLEAKAGRSQARKQTDIAKAINRFFIKDMLSAATPEEALGKKITVEEVLKNAELKIDAAFPSETEEAAAVRMALASAYKSLALYDKAEPHAQRALDIRQKLLGPDAPDTLEAINVLGQVWVTQGRYAEAEELFRQTLENARRALGEEHRVTLELQHALADVMFNQRRWDEATDLYRQCLLTRTRVLGEEDPDTLETMERLAFLVGERMGEWREAKDLAQRCLEVRQRVLPSNHPDTLQARNTLGQILYTEGKWREAEELQRQTVDLARGVWGPSHYETSSMEHNLAMTLYLLDRLGEAEDYFQESVKLYTRLTTSEHPQTLLTRLMLAFVLLARGKLDLAEREFHEILAVRLRVRGLPDFYEVAPLAGLGFVFQEQGKWTEAEDALTRAVAGHRRVFPGHFYTQRFASRLAVLLDATGKRAEAGALFAEVIAIWRERFPPDHPELAFTLSDWAEHLLAERDFRQAEPVLTEALRIERDALPAEHRRIGQTLCTLGWLKAQTGQAEEGERLLKEGLMICRRAWPADHWLPADSESRLGGCLTSLLRYEEAEKLLLSSYEILEKAPGTPPQRIVEAADRIVKLYETWKKPDKAAEWKAKRPTLPKPAEKGAEKTDHHKETEDTSPKR
jgi:serine/threonine protein kinase/tetratricopeptide (TPR) repeat protein